jgi:hypothetical protein
VERYTQIGKERKNEVYRDIDRKDTNGAREIDGQR